ncbi:MAG: hypothetical protein JSV66_14305 [Trueperaceae bacterium]|nr:MAG: hypothetical protein JSV66_14305 [Trueperaceae bacterium]
MLRWAVPLNEHTRSKLSEAELQLGSPHKNFKGDAVLAFRDRFLALKVAKAVGMERPDDLFQSHR